jgi:hypothetical protein
VNRFPFAASCDYLSCPKVQHYRQCLLCAGIHKAHMRWKWYLGTKIKTYLCHSRGHFGSSWSHTASYWGMKFRRGVGVVLEYEYRGSIQCCSGKQTQISRWRFVPGYENHVRGSTGIEDHPVSFCGTGSYFPVAFRGGVQKPSVRLESCWSTDIERRPSSFCGMG